MPGIAATCVGAGAAGGAGATATGAASATGVAVSGVAHDISAIIEAHPRAAATTDFRIIFSRLTCCVNRNCALIM
jgi:hypothetical protein